MRLYKGLHIPAAGVLLHPLDLIRSCCIFWGMGYDETFFLLSPRWPWFFFAFSSHFMAGEFSFSSSLASPPKHTMTFIRDLVVIIVYTLILSGNAATHLAECWRDP